MTRVKKRNRYLAPHYQACYYVTKPLLHKLSNYAVVTTMRFSGHPQAEMKLAALYDTLVQLSRLPWTYFHFSGVLYHGQYGDIDLFMKHALQSHRMPLYFIPVSFRVRLARTLLKRLLS